MNPEHPNIEDSLSDWLAAYDAALSRGLVPPDFREKTTREVESQLKRSRACLDLLETIWPRTPARPASAAELPGELQLLHSWSGPSRLGRFLILRELGRGGCGIVFLAFDATLGRRVALKVPRAEALLTPELRTRFLREAQAAAGLDHPNLVPVYEAGEVGAVCYIASAYCPGIDLSSWLKQHLGPVPFTEAAGLIATLAEAVHHAHQRGIIHRDLKPGNVLLQAVGSQAATLEVPRITDFGLAKLLEREMDDTTSGVIVGTPPYMAPEQAASRRKDIGPATDVYALGAVLYELLTGRPPFWSESALETLEQARTQPPRPPREIRRDLPAELETICLKCLEKETRHRYASAEALTLDLRRFLAGQPIIARRPSIWERVVGWCRRPERMRDAGTYMMFVAVVLGLWCLTAMVGLELAGELERPHELVIYAVGWVLIVYFPMFMVGWKTVARKLWAIWTGLGISLLLLIETFLFNWIASRSGFEMSGVYDDRNPQLRQAVDFLIGTIAGTFLVSYVLALISYYAHREKSGRQAP